MASGVYFLLMYELFIGVQCAYDFSLHLIFNNEYYFFSLSVFFYILVGFFVFRPDRPSMFFIFTNM